MHTDCRDIVSYKTAHGCIFFNTAQLLENNRVMCNYKIYSRFNTFVNNFIGDVKADSDFFYFLVHTARKQSRIVKSVLCIKRSDFVYVAVNIAYKHSISSLSYSRISAL